MTNKKDASEFSIEKLKEVTDKYNQKKIKIPSAVYSYRSYYGMPSDLSWDDKNEDFAALVAALAYLLDQDMLHLMRGAYERYWAMMMGEEYHNVFNRPREAYKERFSIIKATGITAKLYQKDILYVYENGNILIVTDGELSRKLRKIREIE